MKPCLIAAILLALALSPSLQAAPLSVHAVRDHGAAGDGISLDTAAVQRALNACSAEGGGTVYFAPGTYRCGSLHLRSHRSRWRRSSRPSSGRGLIR